MMWIVNFRMHSARYCRTLPRVIPRIYLPFLATGYLGHGQQSLPASSSVALRSPLNANPLFFPNLPVPVNGMIRTYENPNRSFQRPYSAKTVFFYKDGDHYFTVSLDRCFVLFLSMLPTYVALVI